MNDVYFLISTFKSLKYTTNWRRRNVPCRVELSNLSLIKKTMNNLKTMWRDSRFFAEINEIAYDKKSSMFLASLGADGYAKIKSQLKPDSLTGKTFADLVKAGNMVYKQQMTVLGRRNEFMCRNRKEHESVAKFAFALREMCSECDYPTQYTSQALRDVFVKGLNLPAVQAKLLLRDNTLTFNEAYATAVAEEMAAKTSADFNAHDKNSIANNNSANSASFSGEGVKAVNQIDRPTHSHNS